MGTKTIWDGKDLPPIGCQVLINLASVGNLPKRSVGEVMHMSGFSRDYAEGWCAGNDNAIHEIRTAGIKVKGE
ncbi:TPA: hypothetical protein ACIA4S_003802 [Salmonella enterica subsp. enterica serovar Typhimurium]|nr:hypothetical protein [Salmonella enterica]